MYGKNFCSVYGQREDMPIKPNPALTLLAMSDLSVEPSQCLFVGDSNVDIYNAINSGAYPVGVLWGFRSEEELKAVLAGEAEHCPRKNIRCRNRNFRCWWIFRQNWLKERETAMRDGRSGTT